MEDIERIKAGLPTINITDTPIIFLDIDGVLNSTESMIYYHENKEIDSRFKHIEIRPSLPFDERAVNNLKFLLLKDPRIKIVLSSTWRLSDDLTNCFIDLLNEIDMKDRYIGKTKSKYWDRNWGRGREIFEWLNENIQTTRYIILDDDSDMHWENCMKHFILVNRDHGLIRSDVDKALLILNINHS